MTTTTRGSNNREIVRVRPFVRVAGNLSLSVSELSANIPRFNAQKMLAPNEAAIAAADDAGAEPDAEVSFFTRDLTTVLPRAKIAAVAPLDEILTRVRDASNWDGQTGKHPLLADAMPVGSLAYAPERNSDVYAGFEPRIVPENITLLAKTTTQTNGGNAWGERTIVLKKGDSVSANLRELGATPDDIKAITAAFGSRGRDTTPKDGYKLRVLLAPASGGKRLQPARVIIATDTTIEAIVALSDSGKYVSVDPRSAASVTTASNDDEEDDGKGVRLYQSIYETAMRNQVPRPVIDDLIRVYSYDVDFQRKVQPGDFVRAPVRRRGREHRRRQQERSAVRIADDRRRDAQVLSLPVDRRQRRRLLRRDRQEREEVPGAQAARRRHHAIGLRLAQSSRSSAPPACTPASTGAPTWARRSSPPATA